MIGASVLLALISNSLMYALESVPQNRDGAQEAPSSSVAASQPSSTLASETTASGNPWTNSILGGGGGLEDHPPCQHCLMGPCIILSDMIRLEGPCAPDIRNHSKRHKDYRRFWTSLKDRGLWQHEQYINRKTSVGLSEVELRELMPQDVLNDTRKRYLVPKKVSLHHFLRASFVFCIFFQFSILLHIIILL